MHEQNHNIKTSTLGQKDAFNASDAVGTIAMPLSPLEKEHGIFSTSTMAEAPGTAARLMGSMNRTHQIISGLGVVLRIVAGNAAIEDAYDPVIEGSMPPLSRYAQGELVAMAASMCEQMRDQMEDLALRAGARGEVKS